MSNSEQEYKLQWVDDQLKREADLSRERVILADRERREDAELIAAYFGSKSCQT
jgi:hypothetical protein